MDAHLTNEQKACVSLMRIIAVLVARTGETIVEIGENELRALPYLPPLMTWRNPAGFTEFVRVDLPLTTVEQIQSYAKALREDA